MTRSLPPFRKLTALLVLVALLIGPIAASGGLTVLGAAGSSGPAIELSDAQDGTGGPFLVQSGETDRLRITGPVELVSLDPALVRDLGQMFLVRQLFAGLVRFNDALEPIPAVAESFEISDDGLVYTFNLDDDARFYDGRQISAGDVVYSLSRSFDPDVAGGDAGALSGPTFLSDIVGAQAMLAGDADTLAGVVAVDPQTVQITLSTPRSTFLMRLASAPGSIVDQRDMTLGDSWWQSPNASGPFAVGQFIAESKMVLVANEHYVLGRAMVSEVDVRIGPAAFGALNLYESNEIDFTGVDALNIERITDPQSPFSGQVIVSPLFSIEYIAFRSDVAPFDDPFIRQALSLGFPRDHVANVSLNGRAHPAQGVIPDGMLGVETWIVDASPDLERARQLIAQSSYGSADNVPPITIYSSASVRAESFRDAIEDNLGLRVDVVFVDWVSYLRGLQNRDYPAYLLYWGADYPDPESMLLTLFGSQSPDNYIDYHNEEFDALLDIAAHEVDPNVRQALYSEANQLLMDDAVVIPFFYDVAYTLVKPWVQGLVITPLGVLYLDQVAIGEAPGS